MTRVAFAPDETPRGGAVRRMMIQGNHPAVRIRPNMSKEAEQELEDNMMSMRGERKQAKGGGRWVKWKRINLTREPTWRKGERWPPSGRGREEEERSEQPKKKTNRNGKRE